MSNGYGFGGEEIKEESSWRYPLGIFLALIVLCAVFLYYYVGPSVDEFSGNTPSPAITEERIEITIADTTFAPAANYTVYPRARRGGERDELSLYAMWQSMKGYSPTQREEFIENAPDTRRIDILISKRTSTFTETDRIELIYLPRTIDQRGQNTPYRLTRYAFKTDEDLHSDVPNSGYAHTELYLGARENNAMMALFCYEEREEIESPDCWRKYEYSDTIDVSYRFKRPYLPEWQAIDQKVREFVASLDVSAIN